MTEHLEITRRVYERAHEVARIWARVRSGDCHMSVSDLEFDWRDGLIRFNDRPSGGGVWPRIKWSVPVSFIDTADSLIKEDARVRREVETAASIEKSNRINELRNHPAVLELGRLGYRMEVAPTLFP